MSKAVILIVDDEEGIRTTLSGIFEDEGYEAVTAGSGEDALRNAKEAVKPHHVINAQDTGILEVMTQIGDKISVPLLSGPFWMRGWEIPNLSPGKHSVWRGTGGSTVNKRIAFTPHIIAIRMDT